MDLVTGQVPVPNYEDGDDDDHLSEAFSAIESFVDFANPNYEPPSAEMLTILFSQTPPRVVDTPS